VAFGFYREVVSAGSTTVAVAFGLYREGSNEVGPSMKNKVKFAVGVIISKLVITSRLKSIKLKQNQS
jgi:hypothetical protein